MLLAILLITFNFSYSQSNHTVNFNGNPGDFNGIEGIYGGNNVEYYVTFDEDYIYFGAFRINNNNHQGTAELTIYIDTDPQPVINSGNGTTIGIMSNDVTPILPFNADHRISMNRAGESYHHKHVGSAWVDQTSGNVSSFTQYMTNNSLEIAIEKSKIDDAKGIYFSMFMTRVQNNQGLIYGYSNGDYPIEFNEANVSTGYFGGIGINTEGVVPTQHVNTPILHTLTNANPTADGKYAHIEINDGFYSVTGDIEVVAGGTVNIGAGSALTVAGNFTNNGEVSLQSTSTSYSSLIPTSVDGSGSYFYNRFVNSTAQVGNTNQNDMISPPLTGQTFGEFAANNPNLFENPNNTSQKLFGPYNKTNAEYQIYDTDIPADANAVLAPGNGYRAAAKIVAPLTSGGLLTFTGTINTGIINKQILDSGPRSRKWNLIGNPYPSYISSRQLIQDNLFALDEYYGSIYGYNGKETNAWTIIDLNDPGEDVLIAPGQGFYVYSETNGATFTFDPSLRTPGDTDDFIPLRSTAGNNAKFQLLLSTSTPETTFTNIYFNDVATLGQDRGYDTAIRNPSSRFSIYSQLVVGDTGVKLGNQALPYGILSSEVIVPIGIDSTIGQQLTLSASESTLPSTVEVYFEDNVANTSTLLNETNYVFTPSGDLSGIGRFTLRFTNKPLSLNDSDLDNLKIYSPRNSGQLIVKGNIAEKSELDIYDLNGRLLKSVDINSNQAVNSIDVSSLSTGIYIVRINSNTSFKIKKVQIN